MRAPWLVAAALMFAPAVVLANDGQTAGYSEEQLHNFARASVELDSLYTGIGAYPSDEWRRRAAVTARQILASHDLDAATYNAIARDYRTNRALSARIRALRMRENVGS